VSRTAANHSAFQIAVALDRATGLSKPGLASPQAALRPQSAFERLVRALIFGVSYFQNFSVSVFSSSSVPPEVIEETETATV
jgi:hypothetical protein